MMDFPTDSCFLPLPRLLYTKKRSMNGMNSFLNPTTMSANARDVYGKFANEIADKLNEQWKERRGTHRNVSKDKKTVLRLALNLHVLYFALGEEIAGRIPTTVPMVISAGTMTHAVELTKYFVAQRGCYEKERAIAAYNQSQL